MKNNNSHKGGNFWFGFFLGGLAGAFIIFILGTKEGKKLFKKLEKEAEFYEEELEEKVSQLQEKGEEFLEQAREVKNRVLEKIDDKKQKISESLVTKIDKTLSNIENVQKKGVELTEEVHHRYFRKNGKPLVS